MRRALSVAIAVLFCTTFAIAQATPPATQPQRGGRGARGPAPLVVPNPALPTLWIASDSTAANGARGWGSHMSDYIDTSKMNVVNGAMSGQSSRTFLREGSWERIISKVKKGDVVLIQFGHNDITDVMTDDPIRQRGSIQALGDETVQSPLGETVHTFGWYLKKMVNEVRAKEATPIILSHTTRRIWTDGKIERGASNAPDDPSKKNMAVLAIELAKAEKVPYVDLNNIVADYYESLGQEKVAAFFPGDHTHTSPEGADVNAKFIVAGLKAIKDHPVDQYLSEKGKAVEPVTKYTEK